jgi:mycoredoxin
MSDIRVYGAEWCEDTQHALEQLDELGVPYEYIDVESDPQAAEWVRQHNGGKQRTPTIDLEGQILVEPDEETLLDSLRDRGLAS